jgi:hypothetical protein
MEKGRQWKMKKQRIDFVIQLNGYGKCVFRFYPRQSSCHSFNENPPKSWDEVYKVYYNYRILQIYDDSNYEVLFDSYTDECSIIGEMAARLKLISEGQKTVIKNVGNEKHLIDLFKEVYPFGDGVSWKIEQYLPNKYQIILWRLFDGVGFRFFLEKNQLLKFSNYLQKCCDYMLAHGNPI